MKSSSMPNDVSRVKKRKLRKKMTDQRLREGESQHQSHSQKMKAKGVLKSTTSLIQTQNLNQSVITRKR